MKRIFAVIAAATFLTSSAWAEDKLAPKDFHAGHVVAAIVTDTIYIPGKATICVSSAAIWTAMMLVTLGSAYKPAAELVYDACSGKWIVKGEDFVD